MAHTCNSSFSGGRNQEDQDSKPAQANSSWDPISKKNLFQKKAGGVAQGVDPEFKPSTAKQQQQKNLSKYS
jgi:hypothetical protein